MATTNEAQKLLDRRDDVDIRAAKERLCVPRSTEIASLFEFLNPAERDDVYQQLRAIAVDLQQVIDSHENVDVASYMEAFDAVLDGCRARIVSRRGITLSAADEAWLSGQSS